MAGKRRLDTLEGPQVKGLTGLLPGHPLEKPQLRWWCFSLAGAFFEEDFHLAVLMVGDRHQPDFSTGRQGEADDTTIDTSGIFTGDEPRVDGEL